MRAFLGVMRRFWIVTLGRGRRALKLLGARRADARASAGIEAFTSGRGEKARIMEGRLSTLVSHSAGLLWAKTARSGPDP